MIDEFKIIRRALPEAEIAALMKNVAAGKTLTAKRKRLARPTWLAAPTLHGDGLAYRESLSMSAKPGAGSDELYYYFTCESDPSLNSGWISEKKYLPGKALGGSFTVKTKDRFGNVSPESAPAKVSQSPEVFNPPRMIVETKGLGDGEIHLGAPAVSGEGVMVRYRFTREGGDARSGWLARPDWTDENVPRGTEVSYQIEIRDGKGEIHGSHTQKKARGRDDTPPRFSKDERMQWKVFPYTRLDRTVRFTARQNPEKDVEYFFQGVAKPDINSGWIKDSAWVTPPMNRGMHQFRFKIRDNSPQKNESAWSKTKRAKVTPKNTFARYSFTQLATLAPDTLVRFEGRVTAVEPKFYVVGDRNSGASVKVIPRSYGSATLPGMLNQKVTVRGHLWKFEKMGRVVDYAVVARDPQRGRVEFENGILAEEKIFPQYSSAASQSQYLGWHRNGWTVDIPNVAAAKEIYLGYASGGNLKIEVNGELEKEIDLPDGNDADGFKVEKITGFNIPQGADLTFSGNNRIKLDYFEIGVSYHRLAGRVTSAAGQPLANASVFFAREKPVLENTIMQSKTDSEGKFDLLLKDGNWQVLAAADGIGYKISRERAIKVGSNSNADVAFKLAPASYKLNFPRENELIFACISEMLPVSNKISEWQAYYPKGLKLERMSFLGPEYATRDGYRWFLNEFDEGGGFRLPDFQNDIPINGATIIARVDHERNDDGGNWRSIVEVFFDRLLLGVQNWDGKIVAKRNGVYKIYDQKLPEKPVVISMVVQPTGQYKIYLDGEEIISEEEKSDMTQLKVKTGERTFANRISVGRGFDAWSTFNGRIGDVCLYKVALDKNERQTVEKQFMQKR